MSEETESDKTIEERLQAVEQGVSHLYTILQVRPTPAEREVPATPKGGEESAGSEATKVSRRR